MDGSRGRRQRFVVHSAAEGRRRPSLPAGRHLPRVGAGMGEGCHGVHGKRRNPYVRQSRSACAQPVGLHRGQGKPRETNQADYAGRYVSSPVQADGGSHSDCSAGARRKPKKTMQNSGRVFGFEPWQPKPPLCCVCFLRMRFSLWTSDEVAESTRIGPKSQFRIAVKTQTTGGIF